MPGNSFARKLFCPETSDACMHLNTERICELDTNKVGLHLSFTCVNSLYPMLPAEAMMSSAPSCFLIFLDPQVQTALHCALLTQRGGNCCRFGAVWERPSQEEGASEPDSAKRKMVGCGLWRRYKFKK